MKDLDAIFAQNGKMSSQQIVERFKKVFGREMTVPRQNITLHLDQLLVSSNLSQLNDSGLIGWSAVAPQPLTGQLLASSPERSERN